MVYGLDTVLRFCKTCNRTRWFTRLAEGLICSVCGHKHEG